MSAAVFAERSQIHGLLRRTFHAVLDALVFILSTRFPVKKSGLVVVKYSEMSSFEKLDVITNGLRFFFIHRDHIAKFMFGIDEVVIPSGSDLMRPELWKPQHWKWFNSIVTVEREGKSIL